MTKPKTAVVTNPWHTLRQFTPARIALGRAGVSLPTSPQLEFQLAHARARDAVHLALDANALAQLLAKSLAQLLAKSLAHLQPEAGPGDACIVLHSAAESRNVYLQRPDLGRRLSVASRQRLEALRGERASAARPYDLAFVIADGLSALAIQNNALPFLEAVMPKLRAENWTLAPTMIVQQGRVAVGDEAGQLIGARAVVVLIGERPGLSSPDSMGLYLTWEPRVGLTDASRNCISNVRAAGMSYELAAFKLHYLLSEAYKRKLSGVNLKDETAGADELASSSRNKFLLAGAGYTD